jgi:hypothetical protein
MAIKGELRTTLAAYKSPTGTYVAGHRCWDVDAKADIALPCATQVRGAAGAGRGHALLWLSGAGGRDAGARARVVGVSEVQVWV